MFSFYIQNFKLLPSFFGCTGQFGSYLVANPEDRFSHDEAHIEPSCDKGTQTWTDISKLFKTQG